MQPAALRRDFRNLAGWRLTVREVLAGIDQADRYRAVVVPMTYFGLVREQRTARLRDKPCPSARAPVG